MRLGEPRHLAYVCVRMCASEVMLMMSYERNFSHVMRANRAPHESLACCHTCHTLDDVGRYRYGSLLRIRAACDVM